MDKCEHTSTYYVDEQPLWLMGHLLVYSLYDAILTAMEHRSRGLGLNLVIEYVAYDVKIVWGGGY